ncbi:hypothetical protein [Veillonella agrestimuris]|uniref:hypothetical protein n=1 Tax=Veillonella agrestimuris TaxID=2941340 RepID=UPI00204170B2|nr:hypothetical protein [Veillonella agrestimuris]
MLEFIEVLGPFLLLGIVAAGLSRISGVAMSMIIVPTLLIWGATPLDVVAFMLLFVVYNNLTAETQDARLNYKELVLFPRWKIAIPLVLTALITVFVPPAGIAFFMACFIAELIATVYKRIPEKERPVSSRVIGFSILAAILTAIGAYVGPMISGDYYFGLVGLAILIITAFAWYAGNHRSAFKGVWDFIWTGFTLFLGLFGIESSHYTAGLTRDYSSKLDRMMPMIIAIGAFAGLMVIFGVYITFSLPSFITAIGAALGIRVFGLYEFERRGSFSYLAIGFAVVAVICLYLVSPVPTGFDDINALMLQPVVE